MKRNLILIVAIIITAVFALNSAKRILSFHGTSQKVEEAEAKLEGLKRENEELVRELEYKKSEKFAEEEIRNKLGLAREGETVVVVPKEDDYSQSTMDDSRDNVSNWQKWRDLLFGSS